MAPLKYPYSWYVIFNATRHGGLADPALPPHHLKVVFPESSKGQTSSALLHAIRKACASPERRPEAGVYVEKTDRHTGEVLDRVRYKCRNGKPVRQGTRTMRRGK
jgi:hypothetical protein